MNKLLKTLGAGILAATSTSISAAPMEWYVDVGTDFGGLFSATKVTPTSTGIKDQADISFQSQTLVTTQNSGTLTVGDSIVTYAGLIAATTNITAQTYANNLFTALLPTIPDSANNGFGNDWFLTFRTTNLSGTITSVSDPTRPEVSYSSGTIELLFSTNLTTWSNFMNLDVISSTYDTANNLNIVGNIDFTGVDLAYADLFHKVDGISFYDNWLDGDANPITFSLDQNLGAPIITPIDPNTIKLSGTHGAQLYFNTVPEPATLGLLGMGMLGFGVAKQRKRLKAQQ
ncbi:PEP-CTERM sorting domain-containing protein [Methylotuvimicrobium sp. KM2]|uniref:PEP-CTERM sorting domain-containing protein n=1 Tax=Methylotuvimicrobium sp. KM2 TaxID=3133976 RepID=UPI0031010993